jgi:hypothetical protein
MCHKLQPSSLENDGLNSGVRDANSLSTSEIANNHAGAERMPPAADHTQQGDSKNVPTENPREIHSCTSEPQSPSPGLAGALRCEVARSVGYDPTGENAIVCGAQALVVCEYCGPMCASCAEETFCFYGEHRLVESSATEVEAANSEALSEAPKPLFEVAYLELKCPHCDTIRLALPAEHTPSDGATLGCPICSAATTWKYLAHGFTQRDLPYHESFDPDALTRGRIPWDQLAALLDDDD